jgi:hypothetical protein
MKPNYVKIKADGIVYWIRDTTVGIAVAHATQHSITMTMSTMILTQYADFVVDSNTNKILKCRSNIEEMVDNSTF